MEFEAFAAAAADIEAADADTAVRDLVTDLLRAADDDLPIIARFVQGRAFPAWDSTTLDVGPAYCHEAIARAAGPGVTADDVEDRLADLGEIGEVAASYDLDGQRGLGSFGDGGAGNLTVREVRDRLRELAAAEGEGSRETKQDLLFGLLNRTSPREARYLVRLVLSEMRIGVGEGTVRDAVAEAFDVPVDAVERAIQVSNDCGLVAETAREDGLDGLDGIELEVGRPVKAMLAQAGTVAEAVEEWDEVAVEWKYDGARVQVHHDGEETRAFSRNVEEVTDALPEVVEFAAENLRAPAILDGEVVAVEDGDPLPFQEVLRRFRRKHDVQAAREDVAVEFHAFDCLHAGDPDSHSGAGAGPDRPADDREADDWDADDREADPDRSADDREAGPDRSADDRGADPGRSGCEDLLDAPLRERHARLREVLTEGWTELRLAEDADAVAEIEREALEAGHEGIMLKNPESAYTPGRRGKNWLKRKPDVETLDLVVVGAEWGEGRRAELLGTFLLGAPTGEGYAPVGKVATGITDGELQELTALLEPRIESEDGREVSIDPGVVFEVGYEEIQTSPTYGSGYALRFPRFVGVRHDKDPGDADGIERIERLAE